MNWEEFISKWYEEFGITSVSVHGLLQLCQKHCMMDSVISCGIDDGQKRHNLIRAIMKKRDTVVGKFKITMFNDIGGRPMFKLNRVNVVYENKEERMRTVFKVAIVIVIATPFIVSIYEFLR